MYRQKTFLCIIPARGGSKGIPRKNIIPLDGKPMIAYVIEAAQKSDLFETIVVSTDDDEIETVSILYNAQVIKRPPELATDDALVKDAIAYTLKKVPYHDYVLLLEPTSPLMTEGYIRRAAEKMVDDDRDMIISVCGAGHDFELYGRLGPDNLMKGFIPKDVREAPRQKRPPYYYINSGIYMGKWDIFAKKKDYFEQDTIAFIMPKEETIHIDTKGHAARAEKLLRDRRRWRDG